MTYAEFILVCVAGCGSEAMSYLDEIEKDFGLPEIEEDDITEMLQAGGCGSLANGIARWLYDNLVEKIKDNWPEIEDEDMDYFVNGSLDTHFYLKGKEVFDWEEIERMMEDEP